VKYPHALAGDERVAAARLLSLGRILRTVSALTAYH